MPDYRLSLALACVKAGRWEDARRSCREAIRLDPTDAAARALLARCYLKQGNKEQAEAEFAVVEALNPPDLKELRALFRGER
jgi:Flp pilus assembly protein TadD